MVVYPRHFVNMELFTCLFPFPLVSLFVCLLFVYCLFVCCCWGGGSYWQCARVMWIDWHQRKTSRHSHVFSYTIHPFLCIINYLLNIPTYSLCPTHFLTLFRHLFLYIINNLLIPMYSFSFVSSTGQGTTGKEVSTFIGVNNELRQFQVRLKRLYFSDGVYL